MAYYRVQIGFQLDSTLPKDVVTLNPHYQGDNPQALADALKNNLLAAPGIGPTWPFKIKVYDAQKPAPSYPLYETTNGTGSKDTNVPRELALCISYYSGFNRPRFRGRLYLPGGFLTAGPGLRPTPATITAALDMAAVFYQGLPAAHNWVVWSKLDGTGRTVTDIWVDDEWDTIRSRGLRGTTRQTRHII